MPVRAELARVLKASFLCCHFFGLDVLPSFVNAIYTMRVDHDKTWACHDAPDKPCTGAIRHLKEQGLPYKVIDRELLTEKSEWNLYCDPKEKLDSGA